MDIKRLLKKKNWTGKELGILEIENMCAIYSQQVQGKTPKPIIDEYTFSNAVQDLSSQQGQIYNYYLDIHEWIGRKYSTSQILGQQLQVCLRTLREYASMVYTAELAQDYIDQLPVIMTEKQYNRYKKEKLEQWQEERKNDQTEYNIQDLFLQATEFYLNKLQASPRKKNPLKAVKKKYLRKPIGKDASIVIKKQLGKPEESELPKKWEFIDSGLLEELFPLTGEKMETKDLELIYNEFKELIDTMLADMDSLYFKDSEKKVSSVPLKEWTQPITTYKELYKLNFYDIQEERDSELRAFDGNTQALLGGVAILQEKLPFTHRHIDSKGNYKPPRNFLESMSIERFFPEAENYADDMETVEESYKKVLDLLYSLQVYNYTLDKTTELYDLPSLAIFKMPVDALKERVEAYNELFQTMRKLFEREPVIDQALQKRKLEAFDNTFHSIPIEEADVPEKTKEQIDKLLDNFYMFDEGESEHFNIMLNRPRGE